ncbi:MAG: biotin synthase BioB [Gammaproteobacteria bacterium]|nr:biotin synthase BioB [Gammaproteobacteria bacterium]MDH3405702.1 biotin synthase BioB [Gammaproteobacteria bacterium]MDH3562952.1 biotin synthase BioB [Gammaproteobacteria bacterium]MDH5487657.1 biotin synthase BioB [Gammaproteobacteria bacterium]
MRPDTAEIAALFELPFNDLIYRAQSVHRRHFDPNAVQLSTLLSIKTGGCSEDCGYCSQSARFHTDVQSQPLMLREEVLAAARSALDRGATRFCMGAAWRGPKEKDLAEVTEMIRAVKELGLETCATLGLLREGQADQLAQAGLDYYNHNLDTSRAHYDNIVHTHSFDNRLETLNKVRSAGIKVCCGGILGMGESRGDRIEFIAELAALDPPPESVPINLLVHIPGTPLSDKPRLDPIEFVRTVAVARIAMPTSFVRLSAGRSSMPDHLQALCFLAGANSIFYGDKLLTTPNPESNTDKKLFAKLGLHALPAASDGATTDHRAESA